MNKNRKNYIIIKGARVNNLKNINLNIPKNKFVVITGLSGSGKSSLAFDTVFAEGNRRYMEGMSSYARSFLGLSSKPDVDDIENLNPPISIDQKSVVRSPRSTVGTLTEIYDYIRLLFAYKGKPHCYKCGKILNKKSNEEILKEIKKLPNKSRIVIMANFSVSDKENFSEKLNKIKQLGYARVRLNDKIITTEEALFAVGNGLKVVNLDVVIDRIVLDFNDFDRERILDSIETAMKIGNNSIRILLDNEKVLEYNKDFVCSECGVTIKDISAGNFSFNNPEGACAECSGLGVKMKVDVDLIIPNKNLSLAEGAIKPWGYSFGKNGQSGQVLQDLKILARKIKFSINTPIKKISRDKLQVILYGDEKYGFKGIVSEMEERYQNTKSEHIHSDIEKYMTAETCPTCQGRRLKKEYLNIFIDDFSISQWTEMSIISLREYLNKLLKSRRDIFNDKITKTLIKEIMDRLKVLDDVGLGYLTLSRSTQSISGGEAQRIRLATQIKSKLTGIIYVLDEPSIGLHGRDNKKLIQTVKSLRDEGNSLLVVEHDREFMKTADWIIDMGRGAGDDGGEVVFNGTVAKMMRRGNNTAKYLKGEKKVFEKKSRRGDNQKSFLKIVGASEHNLKNIDVKIPLERMTVICGVSGSGKSTLVEDILAKVFAKYFYDAKEKPGKHKRVEGLSKINKVINVTQAPIGKTPRSNAATYTGVFSHVRELFAQTDDAKKRHYTASRFSFNMRGGRCEVCQGEGKKKIEMHLLPDMYVKCEACDGTRYNKKTLEIEYQGVNIAEVLKMSVSYALHFFKKHPLIYDKLKTMEDVGLGYLKLGQSAVELSGGEAQRIKLATELARKSTGKTMYILDEPTVGLHFEDIGRLLKVCDALVKKGNSVLIVEHNTDVIKSADWVIELGYDGGEQGGEIVFEGTPQDLKKCKKSPTGKLL